MHSKRTRISLRAVSIYLLLAWAGPGLSQQEEADERLSTGHKLDEETLPEHRVRPLPADTFKPSEEISEDYPVPFPVDI
jgi:hypothetical protein